jgi:hypothetical protein
MPLASQLADKGLIVSGGNLSLGGLSNVAYRHGAAKGLSLYVTHTLAVKSWRCLLD